MTETDVQRAERAAKYLTIAIDALSAIHLGNHGETPASEVAGEALRKIAEARR